MNDDDVEREIRDLRRIVESQEKRIKKLEDQRKADERAVSRLGRF